MDLILCEKPSQGVAYAAALGINERGNGFMKGNGYVITWCIGHVMGMADPEFYDIKYKKWVYADLPIFPDKFKLVVSKDKQQQYKIVVGLLKKANRCIISTDFDREGEAIAREVLESVKFTGSLLRVKCSSYEPADVRAAFKSLIPGEKTLTKYYAQIARSRADWLVGMNLSRMISIAYRSKSNSKLTFRPSIGRVQTPLLNICVIREKSIRDFKPKDYYHVGMNFSSALGDFHAVLQIPEEFQNELGGLDNFDDAQALAFGLNGHEGVVRNFKSKLVKENAPLPFIPSSLSVEAEKLSISTAETKSALQTLYEAGLITYPRTDNSYLPKSMLALVPDIFCQLNACGVFDNYIGMCDVNRIGKCWKDVDASAAAHHGIVPTVKAPNRNSLTDIETQIYDLICIRYLQQFMDAREFSDKEVIIEVGELNFIGRSKQEVKSGWFIGRKSTVNLTEEDEDEDDTALSRSLPDLHENDFLVCRDGSVLTKKKTKPQRFTEATLLVEMSNASKYLSDPNLKAILKKTGLGTEATQSDILNNELRKKNLVIKNRKIHVPAEVEAFIDFVPSEIKSVDTTALWEEMLALIESGELALDDFMQEIKSYIDRTIGSYRV